nr:rhodanese-like domain-containing protein [Aeromicrobium senzhongii]
MRSRPSGSCSTCASRSSGPGDTCPGRSTSPLGDLPFRVDELDPERPVLVVCHLGQRSAHAAAWLTHRGHEAINLEGGMDAWEAAGRTVVT